MSQFANVMEVFALLEKNNCRKCGEKTCMVFAANVFMGKRQLDQCPLVDPEVAGRFAGQERKTTALENDFDTMVAELKSRLKTLDLAARAETIGAVYKENRLALKIMGKDFSVDDQGNGYTDIHVNSWILVTVFNYILHCQGIPLAGNWVPLRELPGGQDWYRLFGKQCEEVLQQTADTYPDLFADLVDLFGGRQVAGLFDADVGVVLSPLPLVPMFICYWRAEDGMESALNLFFDSTASANLGMDGLYQLGVGIARMLEKLALQHGATGVSRE